MVPGAPGQEGEREVRRKREVESICMCGKGRGLSMRLGDQRPAAANF